jgi:ribosome-associated protein
MSTQEELYEIRRLAIGHLYARKAQDVSWLDLRGRSTLCDSYVLATCQSEVQLQSILGGLRRDLGRLGRRALRAEAAPGSRWGVLDFGDLIVHVFLADARAHYALESLWKDAVEEKARPEDYPLPEISEEPEAGEQAFSEEEWE